MLQAFQFLGLSEQEIIPTSVYKTFQEHWERAKSHFDAIFVVSVYP